MQESIIISLNQIGHQQINRRQPKLTFQQSDLTSVVNEPNQKQNNNIQMQESNIISLNQIRHQQINRRQPKLTFQQTIKKLTNSTPLINNNQENSSKTNLIPLNNNQHNLQNLQPINSNKSDNLHNYW